jgi:hypothetical protein
MLEAILGVNLDLSTLYHEYFMFLGALKVKALGLPHIRIPTLLICKTQLALVENHYYLQVFFLFFFHHGVLMHTFGGVILWMFCLVLVDVS